MFSIKLVANNVFYIGNLKKLLKNITNYKSNRDNLIFALFLALINSTYKFILCLLRRFCANDKINSLIAGLIAGLWSILENSKRRKFMTILLLSRAMDTGTRLTLNHNVVGEIPHFNVFIWVLCALLQQYVCAYEKDCLNP